MISIIVPVYNTAPYLRSCIESILSQTLCDWELILVDDSSTDGSELICDEYAAKEDKIRVIHQSNGGPAKARNQGLKQATGDIIAFVDSDDLLHERYLEILANEMCDSKADVVMCPYVLLSEEDRTRFDTSQLHRSLSLDYKPKVFGGREAIEQMLYQHDVHSAPFKLYRRQVLKETPFPEQFVAYEDLYAMLDIFAKSKKVSVVNLPLYFYFKRENGTLNTWSLHDQRAFEVMKQVREWIKNYDESLLPSINSREVSLAFNLLRLAGKKGMQIDSSFKETCWQTIRRHRKQSLFDPQVRVKNKIALLFSYLVK